MASKTEAGIFMMNNAKYFENSEVANFTEIISDSDITMDELSTFKFKNPTAATILSVALGLLGIDRFYSGNYIMGVIKLFTLGCYGIWWIVDWFLIGKAVKRKNQLSFFDFLQGNVRKSSFNIETIKRVAKNKEVQDSVKDFVKSCKETINTFDINR